MANNVKFQQFSIDNALQPTLGRKYGAPTRTHPTPNLTS